MAASTAHANLAPEPHELYGAHEARARASWEHDRAELGCPLCGHGHRCPCCGLVWCDLFCEWGDPHEADGCEEWGWSL